MTSFVHFSPFFAPPFFLPPRIPPTTTPEMPEPTISPIRRLLKRSASTASLPTPPRTHRKRGRGRSRGSCDSDSDDQVVLLSDEEELGTAVSAHKKRRTGNEATQEDEDVFWLGGMTTRSKTTAAGTSSKMVDPPAQAPLVYRGRQAQKQAVGPVSPPPSHRKPVVVSPNNGPSTPLRSSPRLARGPPTASPPVTPKRKTRRQMTVLRDSPQNPFLASPLDAVPESDSEETGESPDHSPRTPYQEKPTVAYVFRGVRREFHNPMYNHAENRPISPPRGSRLPAEHPAFSPDPSCPPKLLFPEAHKRRNAARGKGKEAVKRKGGDVDVFGGGGDPMKPRSAITLDKELKKAGERR